MTTLLYIADPMCSWCYGFGPELSKLMEGLPELPLEIIVGGLRAYQDEPLNAEQKEKLSAHWRQVREASNLPIKDDLLARDGFVYNTEPACRAVYTVRAIAPKAAWPAFQAIQHAFYAEGRDVTDGAVLAEIASAALNAAGSPITAEDFQARWKSEQSVLGTYSEFEQIKKWGITGFPTLVLERNRELNLVTSGFVQMPMLVDKLQAIVDQQDGPKADK
jgi:putative protein-disulfide isomerase